MDENPLYVDQNQQVSNTLIPQEGIITNSDPLSLNVPDDELIKNLDKRISQSRKWFEEKYNLTARRKKNEMYLFGRQVNQKEADGKLKDYETRSADNALYEIEASLKPLAMSKLPDLIITAGGSDEKRKKAAEDLSTGVDNQNKQRSQREVLGLAFKHLPVYFTSSIKARWDSNAGDDGEEKFEVINPEYLVVDHTSTTKNADDMGFIAQIVPITVQELLIKFPKKKVQIYDCLKRHGVMLDPANPTESELATEIKIWEVWFDWQEKKTKEPTDNDTNTNPGTKSLDDSTPDPFVNDSYETVTAVMWKYEELLLDKMKDPNRDFKGTDAYYIYDIPGDQTTKHQITPEEIFMTLMSGGQLPTISKEKVYNNYFNRSHKPYYFFGYDQWGKMAYDETSRIEQNIRNQENLDDQNKTILDQLKARVKHIWSKESGLKSGDIQRMDMDNPKLDALVEGNVNDVHASISPERPDAAQFQALEGTRSRMYSISGSTAIRGQLQSKVATSNQIAREADFTRSDDLVEDTINGACQWMAEWRMQFVKLRYTKDHIVDIMGAKGAAGTVVLRRDMVQDGMKVMIKASSTDKLTAQRNAMSTAQLGPPFTNPLDFFQDMGMSDPEGRTERGVMYASDPQGYYTKYVLDLEDTPAMTGAVNAQVGAQTPGVDAPQADSASLPSLPQNPTPQNTSAIPTQQPSAPEGSPRGL